MTVQIYSTDAYTQTMDATVVDVDRDRSAVLLDRTVFYPGGGGQPADRGALWIGDDRLSVEDVVSDRRGVWHVLRGGDATALQLPAPRTQLRGALDWDRRLMLMRTHTAMHAMCGVVWRRFASPVTGGNMEPGEGRLDFEITGWDGGRDRQPIEDELNARLAEALPVEVSFLPRAEADADPSLIRTKVSLLPAGLREVRVIDIVGLDRQADGGTHVDSTAEVGRIRITKVDNKGKGFRRIRFALVDGAP
jgi:misacylated tRNA(Ala) deacylase